MLSLALESAETPGVTRPVPRLLHTGMCHQTAGSAGTSCSPEGGGASAPGPLGFEDIPGSAACSLCTSVKAAGPGSWRALTSLPKLVLCSGSM